MPRTIYLTFPPRNYQIQAIITGYSANFLETDSEPEIMADGKQVKEGVIACPNFLDFGIKIIVDGKPYICSDRMNRRFRDKINPAHFDIYFTSTERARAWGIKYLKVRILEN